jgi:hypothetical protein
MAAILTVAVSGALLRADVRVFVTPASQGYGLTVPANAHRPTFSTVDADGNNSNAYDYYYSQHPELPGGAAGHYFSVAEYPPIDAPSGTPEAPLVIDQGDFAYIWFQFRNEPKSSRQNGIVLCITGGGGGFIPTYYLQNDTGGDPAFKRWDGTATPPDYPEWHANPQTMVSITAYGLVNGSDDPQRMHDHQAGTNPRTGVTLLGAILLTQPGDYSIEITAIGQPAIVAPPSYFTYVPEPAACWMVAGLIALALRRRG